MKTCTKCKKKKTSVCFNKNKSRKDGLQNICKKCSRARSKEYYRNNKEKHLKVIRERNNKLRSRNREYVVKYLRAHPCIDCGETNILFLEFDHRCDKIDGISTMINCPVGLDKLKKEIQKCDIRCMQCHRIKTSIEFNWWIRDYLDS